MSKSEMKVPQMRTRGTVRVTLPAKIAYEPEALKRTIGGIVGRLGCPTCFSGADCHFNNEREFVVDPAGAISALSHGAAVALNPQPLPPKSDVVVSLAPSLRYNIDGIFKAIDAVIGYQNEVTVIGVNEAGVAHQYGG
jgi:hypothetical protein